MFQVENRFYLAETKNDEEVDETTKDTTIKQSEDGKDYFLPDIIGGIGNLKKGAKEFLDNIVLHLLHKMGFEWAKRKLESAGASLKKKGDGFYEYWYPSKF